MTLSVETKRNSGSAGANSTQESSNEIRSFEAFKPYLGRGFSQRACGGKYCASQRSIRRISCAFDRHLARESDAIQLRYRDDVTLVLVSGPVFNVVVPSPKLPAIPRSSPASALPGMASGNRPVIRLSVQANPTADYFNATEAFILSDSPTNPPGLKKGVQKILQCITMKDDDNWTATAVVKFFNHDGTTSAGCAEAQGMRLSESADQP